MASGYSYPTIGRGKVWRNNTNKKTFLDQTKNVEKESGNADLKNCFGITQEPWSFYQSSIGGLDESLTNDHQFEYDDELEEEDKVSFQQTEATKNVINILSGTCSYLTDIDNSSTSTCGEAADHFFTSLDDAYNSPTPLTAKYQKKTEAVATTSTDYMKNKKTSAPFLKESPVNKLEEVSKCKKLPAPSYSLVSRKKTVKGFVAVCEFLDYVATGYGDSQNEAKEEAAVKMLKNLHIEYDDDDDTPSKYDCGFGNSFQYNFIQEDQNSVQRKKGNEFKAPHFQQSNLNFKGLQNFQRARFQQNPGSDSHYAYPELAVRPTGNKPYIWLLQSLASKMNFEVKYEVSHRTSSGLAQCLVRLCKDPPVVCYGSAKSEYKAKSSAARCAFEYLKIVCQK